MASLMDRLKKASKIELTNTLDKSELLNKREMIDTGIPAFNIVLGGSLDGGLSSGLTILCGQSRVFKSVGCLVLAAAYLKHYEDAVMLFYDSEMGASLNYFKSAGIDESRVLHIPISDIEQLKFDVVAQLQEINRGDHVVIVVDSIGNLASKKEVEDAIKENSAADMSRAKALKSFGRLVTPMLNMKNIPMVAVNHVYQEMSLFPKDVMSGGCLLAGTKIQMADGSLKNIEDVKEGDLVKTKGNAQKVEKTWTPETLDDGNPECYEIEFEDGHKVVCSKTHKFLINDKWIEAQNLAPGDDVQTL